MTEIRLYIVQRVTALAMVPFILLHIAVIFHAISEKLTADQIREMTRDGTIAGGMIPKTETALDAIASGVRAVVILDGRAPNACLLELFTEHGAGSLIRG